MKQITNSMSATTKMTTFNKLTVLNRNENITFSAIPFDSDRVIQTNVMNFLQPKGIKVSFDKYSDFVCHSLKHCMDND